MIIPLQVIKDDLPIIELYLHRLIEDKLLRMRRGLEVQNEDLITNIRMRVRVLTYRIYNNINDSTTQEIYKQLIKLT